MPRQSPVLEQYQQTGKGEKNLYPSNSTNNKILSLKHHPLTAGKCPHRQSVIDKQPRSLPTTYHRNTTTTTTITTITANYYQNDPRNRNHLHRTTPQLRKPPSLPPPQTPILPHQHHTNIYKYFFPNIIALLGSIPPSNPLPGENPRRDYSRRKPLSSFLPSLLPSFIPRIRKKEQINK